MSDNEPSVAYIKNERVELTKEPPKRQPPVSEQLEDAMARLTDKRAGDWERRPESDAVKASRLRNEEDGVAALRVEDGLARERAEREAETKRQAEAQQANQRIEQAAEWHQDDQQTLQQIQSEVQEFEQAKTQLADAQRFAKQHPDRVSAQQRQDLEEANNRLLQKQTDLQEKGATVQQAAQTKSLHTEQARLLRDVPELADPKNAEKLVQWAVARGVPEDEARSENRRAVIVKAWNAMKAEESEAHKKHLNRPRKPVQRRPGLPSELTVEQARKELKKGGTMTDAINLITLSREKANES